MKNTMTIFLILSLAACSFQLFAAKPAAEGAKDTLILNDGKIVTGTIEQKSLDLYDNMQANLNSGNTFIDEGKGDKPTKIANSDIHYFILEGTKYARHKLNNAYKFMRVISEGKAGLYDWGGHAGVMGQKWDPVKQKDVLYVTKYELGQLVLFVNDRNYNPTAKYVQKHFGQFFGDCATLMKESKAANYDFSKITEIVTEYNACAQK